MTLTTKRMDLLEEGMQDHINLLESMNRRIKSFLDT
jgi:hypothetical protein